MVYIFELENGLWVEKSTISPPNNYSSQIFSHDISASENYLTIGTTGVGNGGLAYVYQMGQDGSEWDLVSTLESIEVNSSNPSLFSIAMRNGQIIMGLPEDSENEDLAGSIQTFINEGWQKERVQKFPPMITDPLIMDFLMQEDEVQGLEIDFNATHPFDSNFLWQIDGHIE